VDPCEVTDCTAFPFATREADYCGGCNANFYQKGELVNDDCVELETNCGDGDLGQPMCWMW